MMGPRRLTLPLIILSLLVINLSDTRKTSSKSSDSDKSSLGSSDSHISSPSRKRRGGQEECTPEKADCGTPTVRNGDPKFECTCSGCTANITCNTGYDPVPEMITCMNNSGNTYEWTTASCNIKECAATIVENGVNVEADKLGAELEQTCDTGYIPTYKTIYCVFTPDETGGTAAWLPRPTCQIVECAATIVENGVNVEADKIGAELEQTCDTGYDPTYKTIYCVFTPDETGGTAAWLPKPTCQIVADCGTPTVRNGYPKFGGTCNGCTANITCNTGYDPVPEMITCMKKSCNTYEWTTASCIIKECAATIVENGVNVEADKLGAELEQTCDTGYDPTYKTIYCVFTPDETGGTAAWLPKPTCQIVEKRIDVECSEGIECAGDNTYCSLICNRCACLPGTVETNGVCTVLPKQCGPSDEYGQMYGRCPSGLCFDPNAECVNVDSLCRSLCICKETHYYDDCIDFLCTLRPPGGERTKRNRILYQRQNLLGRPIKRR